MESAFHRTMYGFEMANTVIQYAVNFRNTSAAKINI